MCPQAAHIWAQHEQGYLLGGRPSRGNGLRGRKVSRLDYSKHRYPPTAQHRPFKYFAFCYFTMDFLATLIALCSTPVSHSSTPGRNGAKLTEDFTTYAHKIRLRGGIRRKSFLIGLLYSFWLSFFAEKPFKS